MPEARSQRIGVIVGSIRKASLNAQLATALQTLAPADLTFHRIRIGDLPHYDADLESPGALPVPDVQRFRAEVRDSDALLFVTPEYNRSIPGVLKNAIDWGSRPHHHGAFIGKPAAVIGATPGALGTANAQLHLRTVLACLAVAVMPQPDAFLQAGPGFFTAHGEIANAGTRAFLAEWVECYARWVRTLASRQ